MSILGLGIKARDKLLTGMYSTTESLIDHSYILLLLMLSIQLALFTQGLELHSLMSTV